MEEPCGRRLFDDGGVAATEPDPILQHAARAGPAAVEATAGDGDTGQIADRIGSEDHIRAGIRITGPVDSSSSYRPLRKCASRRFSEL